MALDSSADPKEGSSSVLEEDTSRSLAAVLKLAAAKGYIDRGSKRQPKVAINSAKKVKLEAKSYMVEDKREDRHHREHRPRGSQIKEVKEPEDYKPEINLEYTDDAGRKLESRKDAFRYMCYKFHGKGPGKNKIDKRLRKQELESKAKDSMSTDAPGSAALMISKQKELQTPYIVLSKGK